MLTEGRGEHRMGIESDPWERLRCTSDSDQIGGLRGAPVFPLTHP